MKKSFVVAALAALILSGCGEVDKSPEAAKGVATEMLTAVKTHDAEKLTTFMVDKNAKPMMPEAGLGSYKVIDQKVEGNLAYITLELEIDKDNPMKAFEGDSSHIVWVLKATDDGWKYVDSKIKPRHDGKEL